MKTILSNQKKPINQILCMLLIFSVLISASGCAKPSDDSANLTASAAAANKDDGEWVYTLSYKDMPEDFGKIKAISVSDGSLFIAGSLGGVPTLYLYNIDSENLKKLEFDNSADNAKTIYGMTFDKSGSVWILAGEMPSAYIINDEMKTNEEFSGRYSISNYNADGVCIGNISIEALGSDRQLVGVLADENGRIVCWDDTEIDVFNTDGSKLFSLDGGGSKRIMSVAKIDGNAIAYVAEGNETGIYFIDMDAKSWGEYVPDEKTYDGNWSGMYTDCSGDRFFINTGRELLVYDKDTKAYNILLNWLDCGIGGAGLSAFKDLGNEKYVAVVGGESRFAIIQKEYREHARQALKLATEFLGYDLANLITQYNSSNPDYKIVPEYYETEDDFMRLNTEVISGKAPDLYNFKFMPIEGFESSGALMDLNPFLDEYGYKLVGPVKSALETNGRLYSIPDRFEIYSFAVSREFAGDKTSWTTDEMNEVMEKCGSHMHKFGTFATKTELLKWVCTFSLANYLDKENGKCSFDNAEFVKLLETCNEMPDNYLQFGDIKSYEDNALLKMAPIQSITSICGYSKRFGGDYTFIGFPNDSGNGSLFSFGGERIAVSAKSEHQDAALDFVKTMLDDQYQCEMTIGMPIVQSALEKQMQDAVDGNLTDFTGEKIKIASSDIDKLKTLIASTRKSADTNSVIQEIIEEEAKPYFEGSRTAEETAKIIQSRVSVYIAEKN